MLFKYFTFVLQEKKKENNANYENRDLMEMK